MFKRLLFVLAVSSVDASVARASSDAAPEACVIKGKHGLNTTVWSQATGGVALAELSSYDWNVEIVELPADTDTGRVRLRARRDKPGLRVDAFVKASEIRFYSAGDLSIVNGHVAIAGGTTLRLRREGGRFDAEPRYSSFQNMVAKVSCSDVTLQSKSAPKWPVPETAAREMRFKGASAKLYDSAGGAAVFDLVPVSTVMPIMAYEQKLGFEHVVYNGEVRVDGWIRSSDLKKPPPPDDDSFGAGGLGLSGIGSGGTSSPKPWTARVDTEVRLGSTKDAPAVGFLEKGARVFVNGGSDGFVEVRLVDGTAYAPSGKTFHVKSSDLE